MLAPAYTDRAHIVPGSSDQAAPAGDHDDGEPAKPRCHPVAWAKLLARVFQVDVA